MFRQEAAMHINNAVKPITRFASAEVVIIECDGLNRLEQAINSKP